MSFDSEHSQAVLENHERRIKRCSSCKAKMIWLKTRRGKNMPTDADTVEPDDFVFDRERHVSHFDTCPNATSHRRKP